MIAAGAPAGFVIAFFWKGDDALSQDFKKWLTQKILNLKLTVPDISSIEPLGKVYDFIFGRRYFALSTFLRVATISIVALLVPHFMMIGDTILSFWDVVEAYPWDVVKAYPYVSILAVTLNILFDYLSVTKSRFLIVWITRFHKKYAVMIFLFIDLILTTIIYVLYSSVTYPMFPKNFPEYVPGTENLEWDQLFHVSFAWSIWTFAFLVTTFLTFLLSTVYSVSLMLLMFFNFLGKTTYMRWLVPENIVSFLRWALPVDTLPVRSIGIVAGAFVFLFVAAVRAVT
jgi:hypothetical protein